MSKLPETREPIAPRVPLSAESKAEIEQSLGVNPDWSLTAKFFLVMAVVLVIGAIFHYTLHWPG
jgi:hypothetical protein